METYIIGIDQSTQGTKALLFDREGRLLKRTDKPHTQLINDQGFVSHDPMEIYKNTVSAVKELLDTSGIDRLRVAGVGISNQRETSLIWDRETKMPLGNAVVWQCKRAEDICRLAEKAGYAEFIKSRTGLPLSPYFPASKLAWLLEHEPDARKKAMEHKLLMGTMDTWLLYKLTGGKEYKTDYSNASRTQLYNIFEKKWDEKICEVFGIDPEDLPQVCGSDTCFGYTDFDGCLKQPIPIHSILGDSHGALFGQGCLHKGMIKATYGTGSSIMMNIGEKPIVSTHGVVTSLAWGMDGRLSYVLEGNINYTGAVITWLKDDVQLIHSPKETEELAESARKDDRLYLVPAFTGLGAPYWDSQASAALTGIDRTTGRAEIVRAGLECIACQITDVVRAMEEDAGLNIQELRADGGPAGNKYLMQFQSDLLGTKVRVPDTEELSGMGAAYAAGLALGIYDKSIFESKKSSTYYPQMEEQVRNRKYEGWKKAVSSVLTK